MSCLTHQVCNTVSKDFRLPRKSKEINCTIGASKFNRMERCNLQGLITKDKYFLHILLCVSAFTDN